MSMMYGEERYVRAWCGRGVLVKICVCSSGLLRYRDAFCWRFGAKYPALARVTPIRPDSNIVTLAHIILTRHSIRS